MDDDPIIPPLVAEAENASSKPQNLERELIDFRHQWKQEIETSSSSSVRKKQEEKVQDDAAILEKAKILFLKGSQLEQSGCFYEAIEYYRKATQLVPDVEFQIDFTVNRSPRDRTESESSVGSVDYDEEKDLVSHLQQLQVEEDVRTVCQKAFKQRATHISVLPVELLVYIFKWVVSPDLDMKSLENLSKVCRGFYLTSRDEEIWRLACVKIWGVNTGKCRKYGGWRNMYIDRPHLHFNGCYFSKAQYFRQGEKSLDNFYRPWHVVEYYRHMRFFPEGKVVMITNSDDPASTVPKLKSRHVKYPGALKGIYRLAGDRVTCIMKREHTKDSTIPYYRSKQKRQENTSPTEHTYHAEFEISNADQRSFVKLRWIQYHVTTFYRDTGKESTSNLLDRINMYPSLIYSRVKSYSQTSHAPLS